MLKLSKFYIIIVIFYANQHMTTVKKAAKGWLLTSLNLNLRLSLPLTSLSDIQYGNRVAPMKDKMITFLKYVWVPGLGNTADTPNPLSLSLTL